MNNWIDFYKSTEGDGKYTSLSIKVERKSKKVIYSFLHRPLIDLKKMNINVSDIELIMNSSHPNVSFKLLENGPGEEKWNTVYQAKTESEIEQIIKYLKTETLPKIRENVRIN
jgi:hypothetical protein